jgi:Tfp pilus assembly protein PilO
VNRINRPVVFGALAVVVAIVLAWWFLLWGPRNRSYNDASAAAQQAQAQVTQLQAQYNRLLSIKQQIPTFQAELAKLQTAVPDKPQLDQIILDINGAAEDSGVQLLSITPTPPAAASAAGATAAANSAPPSIRVSLSLKGGYDQVLDFINRLVGLPRLLVIDTVGLTSNASGPATSSTGSGTAAPTPPAELTISLTVRLFTTTAQPAAGSTTTTTAPAGGSGTTTTTVPGGGGTATTSTTAPTTATTSGATGG